MATNASYKDTLLRFLPEENALTFGTYTLKSGRVSPYFFTSTSLNTAEILEAIACGFASVLESPPFSLPVGTDEAGAEADGSFSPHFDIIFGPAYKGIPLASIVTTQLAKSGKNFKKIRNAFNRKEIKDHGEKGSIIGPSFKGKRVLILDDVMTAGTALREAVSIIKEQGGAVAGVVLMLDRQERVSEDEPRSAMKVAEDALGVPVSAILTFEDLLEAIESGKIEGAGPKQLEEMKEYRQKYGSTN